MPARKKDTKNQTLTVEYVLKNVIPVPFEQVDAEGCSNCAFFPEDCVPCDSTDKTGNHSMWWKTTPNCDDNFFNVLNATDVAKVEDIMLQALVKYVIYTKINTLISKNLTPYRCNDLYPECYSCHLGEHPDLCQMGCSCRNPNGKNFINVVWRKNKNFGSDNFLSVLGKYNPKDINNAVQMFLSNLISENKLCTIK